MSAFAVPDVRDGSGLKSPFMIVCRSCIGESAEKGTFPVSSSYATTPTDQKSTEKLYSLTR